MRWPRLRARTADAELDAARLWAQQRDDIPFQITVHNGEENLEEQVDGVN